MKVAVAAFGLLFGVCFAQAQDVVEFHIPAGTGDKPWNTAKRPVEVKVRKKGEAPQILRIINDDSVAHYLHTPGSPCEHGDDAFATGQHYDCVITSEASPEETVLYDHQYGARARFYVRATK